LRPSLANDRQASVHRLVRVNSAPQVEAVHAARVALVQLAKGTRMALRFAQ
jgi:hypothetical protein